MGLRRIGLILVVLVAFGTACGGDEEQGDSAGGISLDRSIGASSQSEPASTTAGETQSAVAKSAFAAMEVARRDLDSAAQAVVDIATARDVGGYLVSSVYDRDDGHGAARVVVHVPSPEFEVVVGRLGSIGEVMRQELTGQDISPEVIRSREDLRRARGRTAHLLRRLAATDDEATRFELRGLIRSSKARVRSATHALGRVGADAAIASIEVDLRTTPPPAPPAKPVFERALGTAKVITLGIGSGAVLLAGVLVPIAALVAMLFVLVGPVVRRIKGLQKWPA